MDELNLSATALSQCLTPLQQLTIKTSLLKFRISNPDPSMQFTFFAKINGREKDYFIIRSYSLPSTNIQQSFYWSNDSGLNFSKFSQNDLGEFVTKLAPLIRGSFSGNPNHKYKDPMIKKTVSPDGEESEEEEEEEEEESNENYDNESQSSTTKRTPPRRLTELERLHYTIVHLAKDTILVPVGALILNSVGQISTSQSYHGLTVDQLKSPSSYLLCREAQHPSTLLRVRKAGLVNQTEFLDSIADEPNNWCIVSRRGIGGSGVVSVSVRSLLWPGFESNFEAGQKGWQQVYFGTGEKNEDIEFMV